MKIETSKYLAKPTESIESHTSKIVTIGKLILKRLDAVLQNFAEVLDDDFFIDKDNKKEELHSLIVEMVKYHDYGKVNPSFQEFISGNKAIPDENKEHSIYSFYIWLVSLLNEQPKIDRATLLKKVLVAYAVIAGHHGQLKPLEKRFSSKDKILQNQIYVCNLNKWGVINHKECNGALQMLDQVKKEIKNRQSLEDGYLLTLVKLIYSILVNSDSIASSEISEDEYQIAVHHLFFRDIGDIGFSGSYNEMSTIKKVNESLVHPSQSFDEMETINELRTLVNKKVKNSYQPHIDIYILESPVGSGKTLSSLALVDELVKDKKVKKLINTFPLNSVQSQYVKTIMEDIRIKEEFVNVVNSESLFGMDSSNEENERPFQMNQSNLWLFNRTCLSNEIIITSHVRFFESFTCIKRKGALGFLSLMDAVVVIDEFQNYRKEYWYQIWGELLKLSRVLGTKFIFTTGTMPTSQKQLEKHFGERVKKVFLPEENEQLFKSPLTKNRCKVELFDRIKYDDLTVLKDDILTDIKIREKEGWNQFIICMSFVDQTKNLYRMIQEEMEGYSIYYLCGRHSTEYKQKLIDKIKKHNDNPIDKVILVTTKTVECGMDFDFDYGYKEFDRFDSVEQLLGRINRSNKKVGCGLKVFLWDRRKLEDEKVFTFDQEIVDLLNEKEFIRLFEKLFDDNRIDIKQTTDKMEQLHKRCDFEQYYELMKVIIDEDLTTDIYWMFPDLEGDFISKIKNSPVADNYPEKVQYSILLRKKLESYKMTVTNKWLNEMILMGQLVSREYNGINYFVVADRKFFIDNCIEKYMLDGVISYIESKQFLGN